MNKLISCGPGQDRFILEQLLQIGHVSSHLTLRRLQALQPVLLNIGMVEIKPKVGVVKESQVGDPTSLFPVIN